MEARNPDGEELSTDWQADTAQDRHQGQTLSLRPMPEEKPEAGQDSGSVVLSELLEARPGPHQTLTAKGFKDSIRLDEYDYSTQDRSCASYLPGVFRPDTPAHSQPAPGRGALRLRSGWSPGSSTAHGLSPPGLPAKGRPRSYSEGGALVLLQSGTGPQAIFRETPRLPGSLLQRITPTRP